MLAIIIALKNWGPFAETYVLTFLFGCDILCANILEKLNYYEVRGLELKGSLVGGKSKLINCFHNIPPATWLILPCSWG